MTRAVTQASGGPVGGRGASAVRVSCFHSGSRTRSECLQTPLCCSLLLGPSEPAISDRRQGPSLPRPGPVTDSLVFQELRCVSRCSPARFVRDSEELQTGPRPRSSGLTPAPACLRGPGAQPAQGCPGVPKSPVPVHAFPPPRPGAVCDSSAWTGLWLWQAVLSRRTPWGEQVAVGGVLLSCCMARLAPVLSPRFPPFLPAPWLPSTPGGEEAVSSVFTWSLLLSEPCASSFQNLLSQWSRGDGPACFSAHGPVMGTETRVPAPGCLGAEAWVRVRGTCAGEGTRRPPPLDDVSLPRWPPLCWLTPSLCLLDKPRGRAHSRCVRPSLLRFFTQGLAEVPEAAGPVLPRVPSQERTRSHVCRSPSSGFRRVSQWPLR